MLTYSPISHASRRSRGGKWTSFSQIESKSRFQAQIANVKHRARAHRYSSTGSTGIGTGIVGSTETFDRPP
eukprot:25406-Pelagococcus_subviridis.AAC.1